MYKLSENDIEFIKALCTVGDYVSDGYGDKEMDKMRYGYILLVNAFFDSIVTYIKVFGKEEENGTK